VTDSTDPSNVISPLDSVTADNLFRLVWLELQRAVTDRQHEWRTPVLASVDSDGMAQARTVVLRQTDPNSLQLRFFTDHRSPKVAEIQAKPQAVLVFWSPRLNWQLRVQAHLSVTADGPLVDSAWTRISQSAAAGDYLSASAPGSPMHQDASLSAERHHLAVVVAQVGTMDWLELSRNGHRRARLTQHSFEWCTP
jgi:pyridoxamine 5'-phosphate oxidase